MYRFVEGCKQVNAQLDAKLASFDVNQILIICTPVHVDTDYIPDSRMHQNDTLCCAYMSTSVSCRDGSLEEARTAARALLRIDPDMVDKVREAEAVLKSRAKVHFLCSVLVC